MRLRTFRNTSSMRIGYARTRGVRCVWLGPIFVLITRKEALA